MEREREDDELGLLDKSQVLLYFRQAPIAEAVEVSYKVNGIIESRRIQEKYPEEK